MWPVRSDFDGFQNKFGMAKTKTLILLRLHDCPLVVKVNILVIIATVEQVYLPIYYSSINK